ncbi:LLM class flavin-dependent oxidoreductase [Comamonas testosteroni]|uniref:Nitrilotriacetate monooxygenase component A n=1 Tax=Comamonas testosteroni TaxID=285 RepID=A0A8B4S110_COMTE|nr:LLM class flavin-dependent oxidoreductase [Comamonas testosteroni]EHN67162.1 monooxygenase [Comamonas testosteroni ATCC 11996]QQN70503.1 LLM class flavin-dependent oxidoreductase [Comamonas testosteroni]SUY74888.1 Nitrilotriacetate monooxygenase component A [Comamonas testosteroni]
MTRQLHLNLFLMTRGHHEGAWRHPGANPKALTDLQLYVDAARIAEAAKFDAVFLADGLVGPDSGQMASSGQLEPLLLLAALAQHTERIGLIGTASTTYSLPYTLARQFATLDHLSKGRAGWNIVTSWLPRAGENYGLQENVEHAERYRIAEEFVAAVDALWRSFPGAAVVDDAASGQYLDIGQVRPVNYAGTHIRTRGPLNVPGSPQGRPVLVQAGQSDTGRAFAAQWAEAIFTAHGSKESAQGFYADIKGQAKSLGRSAEGIVILPGISAAIGSTEYEARQVWEELDSLTSIDVGLGRLSARFGGHDFSGLPLDRRLTRDDFPDPAQVEASRSRAMGYVETTLRDGLTLRQLLKRLAGARGHLAIAGTPEQVADTIEDWFRTGAADGFNVMPPVITQQLELFASEVVPILRKRGLFRSDYQSSTLRGHFGLPDLPAVQHKAQADAAVAA